MKKQIGKMSNFYHKAIEDGGIVECKKKIDSRLVFVDVFRGIAVALMIVVNNQGDWRYVYYALRHARWHGFLGADVVFPLFLFIMGISISLSISASFQKGIPKRQIVLKIFWRTAILIFLGIFINLLPHFDISSMRIPGVLQRIGLCYGIAALVYVYVPHRWQWEIAILIMIAYSFLLLFITPNGFGINPLLPHTTVCFIVDRALLGNHTYQHGPIAGFDPEGIVSTFGAVVSTMAGLLVSPYIIQNNTMTSKKRYVPLLLVASILIIVGFILSPILPINKNLWTPTYVLLTSGICIILLVILKFFDDCNKLNGWVKPFQWLGLNSFVLYIFSSAIGKLLATIAMPFGSNKITLKAWVYVNLLLPWLSHHAASLAYAVIFLFVWVGMAFVLHRNNLVITI